MLQIEEAWKRYDVAYSSLLALLPIGVLERCRCITYAPGDVIVNEGDSIAFVYFIVSGVVDGMKRFENGRDYQYFQLDQGNGAIGLLELFSRQRSIIATIVAKTRVTVRCADAAELYLRVMEDPCLLRKYTYHIAMDLYNDSGKNGRLFYQSGLERVRSYLVGYYANNRSRQDTVIVQQTYDTIANQLGVSTRTIGRAVHQLQRDGLLRHVGKYICIDEGQYLRLKSGG